MANTESNGVVALLSLFVPGLGQMVQGRIISGIVWFIAVLVGYMAFIVPGVILHLICIVKAAR